MSARTLGTSLLAVAAIGCAKHNAPASPTPEGGAATTQQSTNRNPDVITHDELQAPGVVGLSVLEAVRSLRPQYLAVRGQHELPAGQVSDGNNGSKSINDFESGKVHSSIDGARLGPLEDLANIRANTIKEIRFLNPVAAQQKFGGSSKEGPVILVVTM
jgi:hypothetical protein